MKKSRIFFLVTIICLIITIICICIEKNMTNKIDDKAWKSDSIDYIKAKEEYDTTGDRTKLDKYEEEIEEVSNLEDKRDMILVTYLVTGGITVIMLIISIVLNIKGKNKSK